MGAADLRNPRYLAVLAVAACLILAVGWWARPRDLPQSPPPVPSETELQELAQRAQRRSLESMTAYFADLATDVRRSILYVPSGGFSGIVWDDHHVVSGPVTTGRAAGSVSVRTATGDIRVESISSPRLPISILDTGATPLPQASPHRAASLPRAGDWIVAVWQADQMPAFAAANFRQTVTVNCGAMNVREIVSSLSLTRQMIGGGLFSMDRDLLGVILPCDNQFAAVDPSSIDEMIARVSSIQERVLARYGLLLTALSENDRRYFKDIQGLLIREVRIGAPADSAGLRPGDVIVALNGDPIRSIEDMQPLTVPAETPFELRVQRGAATRAIALTSTVAAPSTPSTSVGLLLEPSSPAYRIDAVLPGSRAARVGVQTGDRLVRVNGNEPRNRIQVERAITATTSAPMLLEVERDGRRIAMVLP